MKQYLELDTLSYNVLGNFIESAVLESRESALFLLGKAAAYIDMAFVLELITQAEAEELLFCVRLYLDGL